MTNTDEGAQKLQGWFAGRIPDAWFSGPLEIAYDRDEILVVGALDEPDLGDDPTETAAEAARGSRIEGFREDTRRQRMKIADEAERAFGRKVSWGVTCGDRRELFTVQAVPAMTRLRMAERKVLDTLVESGVARSRSHALAWCVRLVGERQEDWLADLREALKGVEQVRSEGPSA
jgi:hypothetical protein